MTQNQCSMIINDADLARDLKAGIANPVEVEKWLLNNVPPVQLAHELAECLIEMQALKPIVITMDQLQAHIRVQGFRWQDGQLIKENRGNFSKK